MCVDESFPKGFDFLPDFISRKEQEDLLKHLRSLDYQHGTFRGQRLKRSIAQFGFTYVYTGRKLEDATPMPVYLQAVIEKAKPFCPSGAEFNQCIVTYYPPNAGIGWHTDAPRFGDCIMGVSLANDARLQFRPSGSDEDCYEVLAVPGSLYVVYGPARWEYQHQIVPVKSERFSLTFRSVTS